MPGRGGGRTRAPCLGSPHPWSGRPHTGSPLGRARSSSGRKALISTRRCCAEEGEGTGKETHTEHEGPGEGGGSRGGAGCPPGQTHREGAAETQPVLGPASSADLSQLHYLQPTPGKAGFISEVRVQAPAPGDPPCALSPCKASWPVPRDAAAVSGWMGRPQPRMAGRVPSQRPAVATRYVASGRTGQALAPAARRHQPASTSVGGRVPDPAPSTEGGSP